MNRQFFLLPSPALSPLTPLHTHTTDLSLVICSVMIFPLHTHMWSDLCQPAFPVSPHLIHHVPWQVVPCLNANASMSSPLSRLREKTVNVYMCITVALA